MKNIFFLLALGLFFWNLTANAQSYIAVQSGDQVSLFTHLEEAVVAAQQGDDIYLPGGPVKVYGSNEIIIDKRLNIYGAGYNDQSNPATGGTVIPVGLFFYNQASGSSITGVKVPYFRIEIIDGLVIHRCWANISVSLPDINRNIFISESVMGKLEGQEANDINVVVDKCVIGSIQQSPPVQRFNGLTLKNSIVTSHQSTFYDVSNSNIENSIITFSGNTSIGSYFNLVGNVIRNCMFNLDEGVDQSLQNQSVLNPIYSQDFNATFVNYTGGYFNPANDYHLKSTSPGVNAGTDGNDLGLYGSLIPFKENGLPVTPHIIFQSIGSLTDQNGNLRINVKVEAQNQ